jgi:hypothetical protein
LSSTSDSDGKRREEKGPGQNDEKERIVPYLSCGGGGGGGGDVNDSHFPFVPHISSGR